MEATTSNSNSNSNSKHEPLRRCFMEWISQQKEDLKELLPALDLKPDDQGLHVLGEKGFKRFEDYLHNRAELAQHDAPSFLCPTWCTSFENAFLWIGGCRPSLSIRLVYSVCGYEFNSQLDKFLQGEKLEGNLLGDISSGQLNSVNELHCKILKEEDKLSNQMASLQEEIADEPLAMIAKTSNIIGSSSSDVDEALGARSKALAAILGEADKLRLNAVEQLMKILTPLQFVDLLVATKKLHLSMHEWGKKWDQRVGKS